MMRLMKFSSLLISAACASSPTSAPTSAPGVVETTLTKIAVKDTFLLFVADISGFKIGDRIEIDGKVVGKKEINWVKGVSVGRRLEADDRMLTGGAGKLKTQNKLSNTYGKGSTITVKKEAPSPSCFAGEAQVMLEGATSPTLLRDLKQGDYIQMQAGAPEEVIGFIHSLQGNAEMLSVEHASGSLRLSENHLLFTTEGEKTAAQLVNGDSLVLSNGQTSVVTSVRADSTRQGMYAPITTTGTVVVDNVLASNYAVVEKLTIPHNAMHASFFFARALRHVGLTLKSMGDEVESMHALPALYQRVLGLDKLLKIVS